MRQSWLGRETLRIINLKSVHEEQLRMANFQLGEHNNLGMPMVAKMAASKILSSPKLVSEWQSEVWPKLAQRFIAAFTGEQIAQDASVFVAQVNESFWLQLLRACNAGSSRFWVSLTSPGLGSLASIASQSGLWHQDVVCNKESDYLLLPEDLNKSSKLAVVSYPHYLSGKPMAHDNWWELCLYCEEHGVRLVNYNRSIVTQRTEDHLYAVARDFPNLSWLEIFDPCDKVGKSEGWSLSAVIGSADFVSDFKSMESANHASWSIPILAGVLAALEDGAEEIAQKIERQNLLMSKFCQVLISKGFKLLTEPRVGHYSLWQVPKSLNEEAISSADIFNQKMLEQYSIFGRPTTDAIAYTMPDRNDDSWLSEMSLALDGIKIEY